MKKIYASSLFILILTIICKDSSGQPGQNLTPHSNNSFDLGAAANRWRTLYVNNIDASGKVNIGGTLGVTGMTSLGGLQVQGPATFTGIGSGILNIDATGALTAGPLTAGQIPSLAYLPLVGGTLSGDLSARGASFTTLSTESFQVTGGTVAAGSVLTSDGSGQAIWQQPQPISGFWSLTGNAGTVDPTNFIGTTDNTPLNFRVNGQPAGRIESYTENTFLGYQAGMSTTTGYVNTVVGAHSLESNKTGVYNTVIGWHSVSNCISCYGVTVLGQAALGKSITGINLTAVGSETFISDGLTNATAIGYDAQALASYQVVVGNYEVTSIGGQVGWTTFSDGRYKSNIKQNVPGLAFITQLQPITYTVDISALKNKIQSSRGEIKELNNFTSSAPIPDQVSAGESSTMVHTGFIAQDVEKTALKLGYHFSGVDRPKDDSKSFYGLRYDEFVVPLVKAVQELSGKNDSLVDVVAQLKDSLTAVVAQMNDRLTKIEQSLGLGNSSAVSLNSAKLFQNAPNPFNQSTHISYYIPQSSGNATIMVTDINGRNIKSVPITATGNGQISLQTAQLTAGTYVYSLYVDGNLIDTKKMVLTK